jgi:hypothetical protein
MFIALMNLVAHPTLAERIKAIMRPVPAPLP